MTYFILLRTSFCFFLISGIILFFFGLREALCEHEFGYLFLAFIAFIGCGSVAVMLHFNIYC